MSRAGPPGRAWAWLAAISAAVACRSLFAPLARGVPASAVESWLFRPDVTSGLSVLALGAWLAWRRRRRLTSPNARPQPALAAALLAAASATFAWAHLVAAAPLVFAALTLALWAFGCAVGGRAGWRAMLWPGLVWCLAVPPPAPWLDAWVWGLQRVTAAGAATLLGALGQSAQHAGVLLRTADHAFLVVEQCSGIRSVWILTTVAVAVRELVPSTGLRAWIPIALAPPVAVASNCARVAYIATRENPAVALADHTPQGVATLAIGTALLYAVARALARGSDGAAARPARAPRAVAWPRRAAAVWWTAMAMFTLAVPAFPEPAAPTAPAFPLAAADWSGEARPIDPDFEGVLPPLHAFAARYRRPRAGADPDVVDLLAVRAVWDNPGTTRLFAGKIDVPDRDWEMDEALRARLWSISAASQLHVAQRPSTGERALVAVLRFGDCGVACESWRDVVRAERSPLARERQRTVVRLVTPVRGDAPGAVESATRTLERFAADFADDLSALANAPSGSMGRDG